MLLCTGIALLAVSTAAAVPPLLNHQGRIAVDGVLYQGGGQFKFALVNAGATTSYWSNDGTSTAGSEPTAAVSLPVAKGLYAVLLGDAVLANMTALPAAVFDNDEVYLRVWFSDGVNGSELISPDHRLAVAPYALRAGTADIASKVLLADVVAPPIKPVVAWGDNDKGQTFVPVLANVGAVAAGSNQSLALLDDGTVVAWGTGPAVPGGLTNVTHLAAGTAHFLARKSDGTLASWGDNTSGQSADQGLSTVTAVAAGEKHSLALLADGTVTAWGDNTFNQTAVPGGLANVTAIAAGYDHCLALKADGTVAAWGRSDAGQIAVPGGLSNVVAIAAGAYHSLVVKDDGTVEAWGWNSGKQSIVPVDLSGVISVAGGFAFSVALKSDGTLVTWGDNTDGQTTVPAESTQVTAIATGDSHVLALRTDLIPAQVARLDQDNVFSGNVGIKRVAATNTFEVEGQASKTTAGNWFANSDRRIKTGVQPLTGALDKLDQVRLVDFRYTEDYLRAHPGLKDKRYLNVIAQEFGNVFPDHVQDSGETLPDGRPILQVDTYPLTIYSAAAVQELRRENEALKRKLAEQDERLRKLEEFMRK
jgi:hypothetical protein